ncbi:MAG: ABC transporter permease [Deinococcota bacterium]
MQSPHSAGPRQSQRQAAAASPARGLRAVFRFLRRLYRYPAAGVGTSIVLVFVVLAIVGTWLVPFEPTEQILTARRQAPSLTHWFGTDHLGRDVFSRVVVGSRDILLLAGLGTALAVFIGTALGLATSYIGGWLEEVTFRIFDSLLAMPALLLALLLLGTLGPSRTSVLVVIAISYVPIVARVVRSVVLDTKTKEYIAAARTQGEPAWYIVGRQVLPSVLPALAVEAALRFSYAIFLVASLGFLGVGVQPPSPDWGLMVSEARNFAALTPWALYFPALAISLLVIAMNLMADGLKRVLQGER